MSVEELQSENEVLRKRLAEARDEKAKLAVMVEQEEEFLVRPILFR